MAERLTDEIIQAVDFNCKDTVISNGKDITITGPAAVLILKDIS